MENHARILSFFNLEKKDLPALRLINLEEDMKRFVPDFQEPDVEKLKAFLQSYVDGSLKVTNVLCCTDFIFQFHSHIEIRKRFLQIGMPKQ